MSSTDTNVLITLSRLREQIVWHGFDCFTGWNVADGLLVGVNYTLRDGMPCDQPRRLTCSEAVDL